MKLSIDLGLAVLCSDEVRQAYGPVYDYETMALACDTSPQAMRQLCERTLAKIRRKLLARGISEVEGRMIAEMLSKQGDYRGRYEDQCPTGYVLGNA